MEKINKHMLYLTLSISIITILLLLFPFQNALYDVLRIVFGTIFILFLPGYFLTLAFFESHEIDVLERGALSFAFSISVVPLLTFYLNLIGLKITDINVFIIALLIILLSSAYIYFSGKYKKGGKKIS